MYFQEFPYSQSNFMQNAVNIHKVWAGWNPQEAAMAKGRDATNDLYAYARSVTNATFVRQTELTTASNVLAGMSGGGSTNMNAANVGWLQFSNQIKSAAPTDVTGGVTLGTNYINIGTNDPTKAGTVGIFGANNILFQVGSRALAGTSAGGATNAFMVESNGVTTVKKLKFIDQGAGAKIDNNYGVIDLIGSIITADNSMGVGNAFLLRSNAIVSWSESAVPQDATGLTKLSRPSVGNINVTTNLAVVGAITAGTNMTIRSAISSPTVTGTNNGIFWASNNTLFWTWTAGGTTTNTVKIAGP
jgi:hypothetical protein